MHPTITYMLVKSLREISIMFIAVTYAPFLKHIGLDNAQITVINWVFAVLMLLAQVPTGIFADKFGRALSIKIGVAILVIGQFAYAYANGFWSALLIEGFVGVGLAFVCGADEAWLASSLNACGDGKKLENSFATSEAFTGLGRCAAGLAGGVLGTYNLAWPWIASGFVAIIAFVCSLVFMHEPSRGDSAIHANALCNRELVSLSWQQLKSTRALKWIVVMTCVTTLAIPFFHYWPLVFREHVTGLNLAYLWVPFYLPNVVGSLVMRLRSKQLANGWGIASLAASPGIVGAAMILMGLSNAFVWLMFGAMALEFVVGFTRPLASAFVQRRVAEEFRATYGSLQALITGSWSTVVMIGVATAMALRPDTTASILGLWWQIGALMLLSAIVLAIFRPQAVHSHD